MQRKAPEPLAWWRWLAIVAVTATLVVLAVVNADGHAALWFTFAGVSLFVIGQRLWQDWRRWKR